MAKLMSGREVNEALMARAAAKVSAAKERGVVPTLLIIRVGEKPGDLSYEKGALKKCDQAGIRVRVAAYPEEVTTGEMVSCIRQANEDPSVHGVLLFRPLPKTLDASLIENALLPEKDVDCMTDLSMSGVFQGKDLGFAPCTAQAVMEILDHYGVSLEGKRAVVIGRSSVIGKPAAMMLLKRNATVTICHTKTVDTMKIARQADVLVAAAGHRDTVTEDFVKDGQVIVDVGINVGPDGKLCGDVDFEAAEKRASLITPVPGGVGAVTTTVLAMHVAEAALKAAVK